MHIYENRESSFDFFKSDNAHFMPHLHKEVEVLYVLDGTFSIQYNFELYTLSKGDLFIAFPNTVHEYISIKGKSNKCLLWIFDSAILNDLARTLQKKTPQCPIIRASDIAEDIKYVAEAFNTRDDLSTGSVKSKTLLTLLMCSVMESLTLNDIGLYENPEWLMKLLVHINENFTEQITLDSISEEIGISKYHLSRTFRARIGCTIPVYINTMRVRNAIELLKSTNKSITQIAFESGFESLTTFFRQFKEITDKTPKMYRD